ncbi:hypothetical protein LWI28_017779 [Acer negundo]|uniref:Uncharacterized protein n=1 Tax=Acer negundo TaxID=4023 RepID=A0AAD5IAR7_ACENE|nr:hypothetical protein LWI28_017779 [Acer negundo]KAK4836316.1 hypothetical protein QYF36_021304 [Acer negundo]
MAVRFLTGPAVMAAASIAVGLRGVLLHIAIVQAALPQGIVPFCLRQEAQCSSRYIEHRGHIWDANSTSYHTCILHHAWTLKKKTSCSSRNITNPFWSLGLL